MTMKERQYLLNEEKLTEVLVNLFEGEVNGYEEQYQPMLSDQVQDYAEQVAAQTVSDMEKYANSEDTNIPGNFCDIYWNFKWDHEKGSYDFKSLTCDNIHEVAKLAHDGELTEEQHAVLQEWCQDWFFKAFGTWGLCYNFNDYCSEEVYEWDRENKEDE